MKTNKLSISAEQMVFDLIYPAIVYITKKSAKNGKLNANIPHSLLSEFISGDLCLEVNYDLDIGNLYFTATIANSNEVIVDTYYGFSKADVDDETKRLSPSLENLIIAKFTHELMTALKKNLTK